MGRIDTVAVVIPMVYTRCQPVSLLVLGRVNHIRYYSLAPNFVPHFPGSLTVLGPAHLPAGSRQVH